MDNTCKIVAMSNGRETESDANIDDRMFGPVGPGGLREPSRGAGGVKYSMLASADPKHVFLAIYLSQSMWNNM
eukprot:8746852-Pyramimonas_sp.AAC.1